MQQLASGNPWRHLTAQHSSSNGRIGPAHPAWCDWLAPPESPRGRVPLFWTLHGLKALDDALIQSALKDRLAEVAGERCGWPFAIGGFPGIEGRRGDIGR